MFVFYVSWRSYKRCLYTNLTVKRHYNLKIETNLNQWNEAFCNWLNDIWRPSLWWTFRSFVCFWLSWMTLDIDFSAFQRMWDVKEMKLMSSFMGNKVLMEFENILRLGTWISIKLDEIAILLCWFWSLSTLQPSQATVNRWSLRDVPLNLSLMNHHNIILEPSRMYLTCIFLHNLSSASESQSRILSLFHIKALGIALLEI